MTPPHVLPPKQEEVRILALLWSPNLPVSVPAVAVALRTVTRSPALLGLVPVPALAVIQNQVEDERLLMLETLQLFHSLKSLALFLISLSF